jgi:hypothetical protein
MTKLPSRHPLAQKLKEAVPPLPVPASTSNDSRKRVVQITRCDRQCHRSPCAHGAFSMTHSNSMRQGRTTFLALKSKSPEVPVIKFSSFRRYPEQNSQMWFAHSLGLYKRCICHFRMSGLLPFHHVSSKRHVQHYQRNHGKLCQFVAGRRCTVHSDYSVGILRDRGR